MSRIVTVFGATGNQGLSVLNSILADGTFKARAVTRDPSSETSQKLKSLGVELVQGDVTGDIESIKNAVRGSEAVFAITQPAIGVKTRIDEFEQGKNLVDASKAEGVKFFVWSSLPHAQKVSGGKYTQIFHFDLKAQVDEYLIKSGLPYAIMYTGYFFENLWTYQMLNKDESGNLQVTIPKWSNPETPMPFTWIKRDVGPATLALLKNYNAPDNKVVNKKFHVITEKMTFPEFAERLSKGLGKPVKFVAPPTTGLAEMDEMFEFESEFGLYPPVPVPNPELAALGVEVGPLDDAIPELKARGF